MRRMIAALTVAVALPATASSQLIVQGVDFQVNTYTLGAQLNNAAAGSSSGFVVVWSGYGPDDTSGIFGQRFASSGARLGTEFRVSTYITGAQDYPAIAVDESGFVVAWTSYLQDGDVRGVFARRFSSNGTPIATEFRVNARTTGNQMRPSVAMSGGSFVVIWEGPGYYERDIWGQRFSSTGEPLGEQLFINGHIQDDQNTPSVAMNATGFFVVVWRSYHDGSGSGIFGRQFNSYGVPFADDFQVNDYTPGYQQNPSVAMDGSGFVVVWDSLDGIGGGVSGRRYDVGGMAQASEFQVNSDISANEVAPTVLLRGGSFVAAWSQFSAPENTIRARAFDGAGASPLGDLQVNAYSREYQTRPSVARNGSGFVVVWDAKPQDGSENGIVARRLLLSGDLDIDGNGAVEPLTDTLLTMRYAFGFRGATLINGAVALNCTRCDAPSIETYLSGLN